MKPSQKIMKGGVMAMWKKKRFVIPLVAALAVTGVVAGSAFAQEEESEVPPPLEETFVERLAEKLGIEESDLEAAMDEVKSEMVDEAIARRLENAVDNGKLTQDEADDLLEWWQDRPDVGPGGFMHKLRARGGHFGGGFGPHGSAGPKFPVE